MDVCISHVSALRWLLRNRNPRRGRELNPENMLPKCSVHKDAVEHLLYILDIGINRLDVLVSSREGRRHSKTLMTHVCSRRVPDGSYLPMGIQSLRACVVSPELAYVQLAAMSDEVGTVWVGNALCSDYRFDDYALGGVVFRGDENDTALTSVARLRRYAESLPDGFSGRDRALRMLRHVHDGARSPMESGLVMTFELPPRLGGYSLGKVTLNKARTVFRGIGRLGGRRYAKRYPDILIAAVGSKGPRIASVDYDAESTHCGEVRRQSDAIRRNQLTAVDSMRHFTLEKFQVMRYEQFVDEVDNVRRSLGRRRNVTTAHMERLLSGNRFELWARVLSGERDPVTGKPNRVERPAEKGSECTCDHASWYAEDW